MSSKAPIFPMPQPQHFSDYGFDPQIDYFQVLEEARKHKRDNTVSKSIDSIHFKLSKPISKEDHYSKKSQNNKRKRWWKNPLFFFKWRRARSANTNNVEGICVNNGFYEEDVHKARARAFRASISGPVYITESFAGISTPRRSSGRHSPGFLAGTISPAEDDDVAGGIPYVSLRQLNMEQRHSVSTSSAMPIYLVT